MKYTFEGPCGILPVFSVLSQQVNLPFTRCPGRANTGALYPFWFQRYLMFTFTFTFKVEKYVFHCGKEQCDLNMSLTQNCAPLSDRRALREATLIPALLILYIRIAYLGISSKKRNTELIYFRHNSTVAARLKNEINAKELSGFRSYCNPRSA